MEKAKLICFFFKQQLTFYSKTKKKRLYFLHFSLNSGVYILNNLVLHRGIVRSERKNLVKYFKNHKNINVRFIIIFSLIHYLHLFPTPPGHGDFFLRGFSFFLLLLFCLFQSLSIVIHSTVS